MNVTAVIPARGGSKGIPKKNLQEFGSSTLLEEAVHIAKSSSLIGRILVSSDSQQILDIAGNHGVECHVRGNALSNDEASTNSLLESLIEEGLLGEKEYFCILQPTSPLRSVVDIDLCIKGMQASPYEQAVTVCRYEHGSAVLRYVGENGELKRLFPEDRSQRRQDTRPLYVINGAVYVSSVRRFKENGYEFADALHFHEMPIERSIDIDTEYDLFVARETYKLFKR